MEIWTNQKGGQRRVKPVLLPLGWFRRWFYEHWQRSKGLKWPLTINFSRVARGRKRLPRNEPERRDNESRNNERRGWLGGKRREKEKRSGGREREREREKEVEARQWGQRQSRLYYRARPRWTVKRTPCAFSFIGPFRFITVAKSWSKLKRASRIFGPNSGRA